MVEEPQTSGRSKSPVKRSNIINAATELFIEHGYLNTSMEQIAKAAAVSKQTVYSHFKDKESLFVETISARCAESEFQETLYDETRSLTENLLRIVNIFSELILSEDAVQVYITCVSHKDEYPQLGQSLYSSGPLLIKTQVTACLQKMADNGQLYIVNCEMATMQLLGMVQGDWHLRRTLGHSIEQASPGSDYLADCVKRFIKSYSS